MYIIVYTDECDNIQATSVRANARLRTLLENYQDYLRIFATASIESGTLYLDPVTFSDLQEWFWDTNLPLSLTMTQEATANGVKIFYTKDETAPTKLSDEYTASLSLTAGDIITSGWDRICIRAIANINDDYSVETTVTTYKYQNGLFSSLLYMAIEPFSIGEPVISSGAYYQVTIVLDDYQDNFEASAPLISSGVYWNAITSTEDNQDNFQIGEPIITEGRYWNAIVEP